MVVILPGERSNVKTLTRDLQHDRLTSILSQLEPKEILVEMPRFQIDYSTDLVNYLKQVSIDVKNKKPNNFIWPVTCCATAASSVREMELNAL